MDCVQSVLSQVQEAPSSSAAVAVTAPEGARGFWISCLTEDCRVSLDGTDATSTNGLAIAAGSQPIYIPVPQDISVIGLNASASDVSVIWVA